MPKYEPCDVTLTLNDVHSMIDEERKLVATAFQYARGAHKDQVRKYTGLPYISHPLSVYRLLREFGIHDMESLCAALLHDVVEDTSVSNEDINNTFGPNIARIVAELTDVSKPEDGNRAWRKAMDRHHISKGGWQAHMIKSADMIDNSRSIIEHDRNFVPTYMREKRALLQVLSKDHTALRRLASDMVRMYEALYPRDKLTLWDALNSEDGEAWYGLDYNR